MNNPHVVLLFLVLLIFLVFCFGRPGELNHRVPQRGCRFYLLALSNLLIESFQSMIIRGMSDMSEIMEILCGVPDSQCFKIRMRRV